MYFKRKHLITVRVQIEIPRRLTGFEITTEVRMILRLEHCDNNKYGVSSSNVSNHNLISQNIKQKLQQHFNILP